MDNIEEEFETFFDMAKNIDWKNCCCVCHVAMFLLHNIEYNNIQPPMILITLKSLSQILH